MSLSSKERAALLAELAADGVDGDRADAIVRAADEDKPEPRAKESPEAKSATSAEPPKVFAYHLAYMRVNEVRRTIGLPEDAPDGDLMTGEWLAKHGGSSAGGSQPPQTE